MSAATAMAGTAAATAICDALRAGFSGSRHGMTPGQIRTLEALLTGDLRPVAELHHGDCLGADAMAHQLALEIGIDVIVHPPLNPQWRAWCAGAAAYWPPSDYLARNRTIADTTDLLIAAPYAEVSDAIRSGTWMTVRYAARIGRPVIIIRPDGKAAWNGFEKSGLFPLHPYGKDLP